MEILNLCEKCACAQVCSVLVATGGMSSCDNFCPIPTKERKPMTPEEAEHVLMHIGDHVVFDDEYGCLIKAPLMDASLLAIRALRGEVAVTTVSHLGGEVFIRATEMCGKCGCRVAPQDHFCPGCGATLKRKK